MEKKKELWLNLCFKILTVTQLISHPLNQKLEKYIPDSQALIVIKEHEEQSNN